MKRFRGFTLIEMLVVIIIIAVIASIAVPNYSRFWAKTRFEGEVREVRDLLAHARERAIANDTTATVSFDGATQTFIAEVQPVPASTDTPTAMNTNADTIQTSQTEPPKGYSLAPDVVVMGFHVGGNMQGQQAKQGGVIRFRGDGTCDTAEIILVSEGGYRTRLTLLPGNALVKVEDE